MKKPTPPRSALFLILCSALPAVAQMIEVPAINSINGSQKTNGLDYPESSSFASDKSFCGALQLPEIKKAKADLYEAVPLFVSQDVSTLGVRYYSARKVNSVLDLSILKESSAYSNARKVKIKVSSAQISGIQNALAEISAAYRKPTKNSETADCESITMSVAHRIKVNTSKALEIVDSEVSANPSCACEIVKTAIQASGADVALVADITEVAITSAPDSMRMISQCAIAAMPEALPAIQAVLAKLDPNRGDSSYSAKDSKSGKDAVAAIISPPPAPANPLNLPFTIGPVTPFVIPPDEVLTNPNP